MTIQQLARNTAVMIVLFGLSHGGNASARYLQPEPMLTRPLVAAELARSGRPLNPYSYAYSNPIGHTDSTGLMVEIDPSCAPYPQWVEKALAMINLTVSTNRNKSAVASSISKILDSPTVHKIYCTMDPAPDPTFCAYTSGSGTVLFMGKLLSQGSKCLCSGKLLAHELGHVANGFSNDESIPNTCEQATKCDGTVF